MENMKKLLILIFLIITTISCSESFSNKFNNKEVFVEWFKDKYNVTDVILEDCAKNECYPDAKSIYLLKTKLDENRVQHICESFDSKENFERAYKVYKGLKAMEEGMGREFEVSRHSNVVCTKAKKKKSLGESLLNQ